MEHMRNSRGNKYFNLSDLQQSSGFLKLFYIHINPVLVFLDSILNPKTAGHNLFLVGQPEPIPMNNFQNQHPFQFQKEIQEAASGFLLVCAQGQMEAYQAV
jgi:hypothetical protein